MSNHQRSPEQVNWRDLQHELAEAARHNVYLQNRLVGAMQRSSDAEGRLRERICALEEGQTKMQARLEEIQRENEQLRKAVRGRESRDEGEDVRRLREQRDAAQRELRHALRLVHDLSGRVVASPSSQAASSEHFDARREQPETPGTRQAGARSVSTAGTVPLHASPRLSARNSELAAMTSRRSSPRVQSPTVRLEDLPGSRGSLTPIVLSTNTHMNEAEAIERASVRSGMTNVTYNEQVPHVELSPREQPAEEPQDLDEPDEPVSEIGWAWLFVDLPGICQVQRGPLTEEAIAEATGIELQKIEEWVPQPTRRTLLQGEFALYHDPTYLEFRQETKRTIIVNWGERNVVRLERRYIWPETTGREFHTFIAAVKAPQVLEWWYVGKLRWLSTTRVPPRPADLQKRRRIASRMLKKWSSELSKDQVVQLIDDRTLVQLNIELVSNDALAAQSARFAEERLGMRVPQGAAGPGVAGPSGS